MFVDISWLILWCIVLNIFSTMMKVKSKGISVIHWQNAGISYTDVREEVELIEDETENEKEKEITRLQQIIDENRKEIEELQMKAVMTRQMLADNEAELLKNRIILKHVEKDNERLQFVRF